MIPPEVQDAIKMGQELKEKVDKKVESIQNQLNDILSKIDSIPTDYANRSQKFIDDKIKELQDQLKQKEELAKKEIDRLTQSIQSQIDSKIEELTTKSLNNATKILTGISMPNFDTNI